MGPDPKPSYNMGRFPNLWHNLYPGPSASRLDDIRARYGMPPLDMPILAPPIPEQYTLPPVPLKATYANLQKLFDEANDAKQRSENMELQVLQDLSLICQTKAGGGKVPREFEAAMCAAMDAVIFGRSRI